MEISQVFFMQLRSDEENKQPVGFHFVYQLLMILNRL
jgi:hypothetical protein